MIWLLKLRFLKTGEVQGLSHGGFHVSLGWFRYIIACLYVINPKYVLNQLRTISGVLSSFLVCPGAYCGWWCQKKHIIIKLALMISLNQYLGRTYESLSRGFFFRWSDEQDLVNSICLCFFFLHKWINQQRFKWAAAT